MNREIKFRAWDKERKRFIENVTFADRRIPSNWKYYFIFQQFTGLLDKKGVEIYEGDILRTGRQWIQPMVVAWDAGTCSFDLQSDTTEEYECSEHLFDTTGESDLGYNFWEVIGNIYEHPELLKG